jgi:hypothetical protein
MRGRRCAKRSRSGRRKPQRLRGACASASSADARAASGLRPGTLRSPARSWLTGMCGPSPLRTLASGMGQIPWPGLDQRLKARSNPHCRNARPDAVNLPPECPSQGSTRDLRAIAAMERRKARRPPLRAGYLRPVLPEIGSAARRATGRVRHRASAVQRSIPLTFLKGTTDKAQPARHDKRAAERWLFDN